MRILFLFYIEPGDCISRYGSYDRRGRTFYSFCLSSTHSCGVFLVVPWSIKMEIVSSASIMSGYNRRKLSDGFDVLTLK